MPVDPMSDAILVVGERQALDVNADEILGEAELAAYAANNVSELVDQIIAGRSRLADEAVYLVDGKRVSGLGDLTGFPAEAVSAVEIFPTGSATQVGANGNQRIINIRLKPRVRIIVARGGTSAATEGGFTDFEGEVTYTTIAAPRRANLSLQLRRNDTLLERERNVVQNAAAPENLGEFRSLRPSFEQIELRGSFADELSPAITAYLTTKFSHGQSTALIGLERDTFLNQINEQTVGDAALQVTGQFSNWLVNFGATFSINSIITRTGRDGRAIGDTLASSEIRARTERLASELSVTRTLFDIGTGPINLSVRTSLSRETLGASGGTFIQSRRQVGGGLSIPIARPRQGPLGMLGEIDASIDVMLGSYSGIGKVSNAIYALQWQPAEWLRMSGSVSQGQTPPGAELLAAPVIITPGTRYLDPLTRESVDVSSISGGNPALATPRTDERQFSVEIRPSNSIVTAISADLRSSSNKDVISSFPSANVLLISAFPDRFVRDEGGRLLEVDIRPVNFAAKREEQLRYGVELALPLDAPIGGAGTRRLSALFAHTVQLRNRIRISATTDPVDLLSRAAFGFGGAEQSRHEVEAALRYSEGGSGLWLGTRYRSAGFINLVDGPAATSLRFAPLATFDLRAFAEGQRLFPGTAFFDGARFTLAITNLTNARQQVRDATGATPLAYQPAYRDPTGRLVRLELRKSF